MYNKQQYDQLMMLYTQLLNGAHDIADFIAKEDYDSAITMIKARESIFLNCENIKKYLEFTPEEKKEVDKIYGELKAAEEANIKTLENAKENLKAELAVTNKQQKLQNAYSSANLENSGSMVNIQN